MSCEEITTEIKANNHAIQNLTGDASSVDTQNVVGLVIMPYALLDYSDKERIEINALSERNRILDRLRQRKCMPPSTVS